ncbi:unnamed protein product [Urochloa humidicola]
MHPARSQREKAKRRVKSSVSWPGVGPTTPPRTLFPPRVRAAPRLARHGRTRPEIATHEAHAPHEPDPKNGRRNRGNQTTAPKPRRPDTSSTSPLLLLTSLSDSYWLSTARTPRDQADQSRHPMVVVAVGGGGGGWGTWEELVLGGAVLRHGGAAWTAVADELRTRSPCAFSPEECEAKFAEIQSRYSACNAWFEELRKQRVAELKRELEKSENSIGSLQSVIESLSNSKHGDGSSECRTSHTESCSRSENTADTSSGKEASRDRSSAASFTEEATNSQKSQQVQRCDTDSIQAHNPSPDESYPQAQVEKVCPKDCLLWGSRKQRGRRVRRTLIKGVDISRDGEPTSTACIEREGSSEGCMKDLKSPKVESITMKKGLKNPKVESGVTNKDLKTPNAGSGVMKKSLKSPNVESDVMKKGLKTPKVESDVMKKGLKAPKAESDIMKKGLKTPKAESDVMKKGLKTPRAECDQLVAERIKQKLTEILSNISTQGDCLMLQRQLDTQRKRVRYKKMIRRHMDFRTLHSKIKSGTISSTKELLRDILIFVNNVIAFYPKATLEHMAAVELRGLACKIVKQSASLLLKSCGETGTAGASVVKKNARALQPGRPGPSDARGSKVSSKEATAKEGEGKNPCSDASLTANQKTIQKNEPVKKRGVGRPPKNVHKTAGAQEGNNNPSKGRKRGAGAQVDSPSKGRKRAAAAQEDSPSKGGKKTRR